MVKQDASSEIKNSDCSQVTFNQCLASANQIDFYIVNRHLATPLWKKFKTSLHAQLSWFFVFLKFFKMDYLLRRNKLKHIEPPEPVETRFSCFKGSVFFVACERNASKTGSCLQCYSSLVLWTRWHLKKETKEKEIFVPKFTFCLF